MPRREFIRAVGQGMAALGATTALPIVAGPFDAQDTSDHFVPADKKLRREWVEALFARGERTWYAGDDLNTIGLPVGGICAGQVYLTGDGRLVYWDIFNQNLNTGYGAINYKVGRLPTEVATPGGWQSALDLDQGFAIRAEIGRQTTLRALDRRGFPGARFCGEYPIGTVEFADAGFPVAVKLEAFSPFIPLSTLDSALPCTVMNYTVANRGQQRARITLAGWLENRVLPHSSDRYRGRVQRVNQIQRTDRLTGVFGGIRVLPAAVPGVVRPPIVFADFEGGNYGDWKIEGEAFGTGPAAGTLASQNPVSGFKGKGLVNTFLGGNDRLEGRLISPPFTIERPWISFLIGGGSHSGTCINLVVDGQIARTAAGSDNERLEPHNWSVADLEGKSAHLEIVDRESGGWGHINIDQIEFRDEPLAGEIADLHRQPDYGTLGLSVLGDGPGLARAALPAGAMPDGLFDGSRLAAVEPAEAPLDQQLRGAVGRTFELEAGQTATVTFVVSWCLPNMYRGQQWVANYYAKYFYGAYDVARQVAASLERLSQGTRLWHNTYYDSSLPHWLLDRLHSTVSNLATTTCQWWRNGRFWAWEGCGCCHGTCGHVWNYAQALARLFPELERSARELQDFAPGIGFNPETGSIGFRGEGWSLWAGDSQGGYILKAYREHCCSADDRFLNRNWRNIRKAVQFLLEQDANTDGLIEGRQHQTYDQDYYGANTFVGALYLGALLAGEAMAKDVGDLEFAATCRRVFESGRRLSIERLFNGEYFVQEVDLEKHPEWQYADGCLADQLFGQSWAHQVGLGYVYPKEAVLGALRSVWKYCWTPDIGRQNEAHPPERWFAYAGEGGLFTCTWPKSKHLGPKSTRYRDEIWTGIEYQVAAHLAWEGELTEALAMCRAIHERYHPAKHNPWNEIECGDHYARALASWGVLTALAGFEYHGPDGRIGFAPRLTPESFRAVFTAAEGWGSLAQVRHGHTQSNRLELKWGRLRLSQLTVELAEGVRLGKAEVTVAGRSTPARTEQHGMRLSVQFAPELVLAAGDTLELTVHGEPR